ncbi:MAG: hypothetical protein ACTHJI_04440 [Leifsonia sp.]
MTPTLTAADAESITVTQVVAAAHELTIRPAVLLGILLEAIDRAA